MTRLGKNGEQGDPAGRCSRTLHVMITLGETSGPYNQHALPESKYKDIGVCTFYPAMVPISDRVAAFEGNGTVRGFLAALRRALDAGPYDIIHAHSPHVGLLLLVELGRRLVMPGTRVRTPTVFTVLDSFHDYGLRHKAMLVPVFAFFRKVVFCSESSRASFPKSFRRLAGRRHSVVANALDVSRLDEVTASTPPRTDNRFVVISVNRLTPVKDPLALLGAFSSAGVDGSALVFVGEGPLRDEVGRESTVAAGRTVELTGLIPRDDVYRRLLSSDLYVSPSHGEGLPVAVLEAMAAGLPVVLSDIPPHRELAAGADFVPLIPPGDVAGFAREIERFAALDPEERAEVGRRCRRQVIDRFGLEKMLAAYDEIYRELCRA